MKFYLFQKVPEQALILLSCNNNLVANAPRQGITYTVGYKTPAILYLRSLGLDNFGSLARHSEFQPL